MAFALFSYPVTFVASITEKGRNEASLVDVPDPGKQITAQSS
jgi:hypothetical protein